MLISELNNYYDVLNERHVFPTGGYASYGVSYLIALTPGGTIESIIDVREKEISKGKNGKEKTQLVPKEMLLPERPRQSTIKGNYVEVRGEYIFGLSYNHEEKHLVTKLEREGKKQDSLRLKHESFVAEVIDDFGQMTSDLTKAYLNFAKNWVPDEEVHNEKILALGAELNKAKFAFCLAGHPEKRLQDEDEVKKEWENRRLNDKSDDDSYKCQCAILGEIFPVAEIHDTISPKGLSGAGINPSLINFKPESFSSYGHEKGKNACISEVAMRRYVKALNWLLESETNHKIIDGITYVFWAKDGCKIDDEITALLFDGINNKLRADSLEIVISRLFSNSVEAKNTSSELQDVINAINTDTDYYIVGLSPNASRVQVKFFFYQKFGNMLNSIAKHQNDMKLYDSMKPVSLSRIKKELTSQKSNHPEFNDVQFLSFVKSILTGKAYPQWLLSTLLRRIRADQDTRGDNGKSVNVKLNDVRVGLIKACLTRYQKEEIKMGLDKESTDKAYLCGRIFAILQKLQEDAASPQKLNRTIKDSYFATASVTPASVMPKLIRLSQHHMSKVQRMHPGWAVIHSKNISEVMDKMEGGFPRSLNLYEQGKFVLGYYQQYSASFEKATAEETDA